MVSGRIIKALGWSQTIGGGCIVTFPEKSQLQRVFRIPGIKIWKKWTIRKVPKTSILHIIYKSDIGFMINVSKNLNLKKYRSVATPRVRHRARAWVQEGQGEEMRATLVFCFGCSTRDAATERIFLIIHNFRIFYPNNLKFWEKFLCTYMNNFPAGSFLYVELPPITLSLFILKSASEVCSLLCWSDLKT